MPTQIEPVFTNESGMTTESPLAALRAENTSLKQQVARLQTTVDQVSGDAREWWSLVELKRNIGDWLADQITFTHHRCEKESLLAAFSVDQEAVVLDVEDDWIPSRLQVRRIVNGEDVMLTLKAPRRVTYEIADVEVAC
ncbi:MAG: hypothetical protein JWP89_3590 [Schlesneria sp.]|nr:hypothetical protein [Schlesneria sp.]